MIEAIVVRKLKYYKKVKGPLEKSISGEVRHLFEILNVNTTRYSRRRSNFETALPC